MVASKNRTFKNDKGIGTILFNFQKDVMSAFMALTLYLNMVLVYIVQKNTLVAQATKASVIFHKMRTICSPKHIGYDINANHMELQALYSKNPIAYSNFFKILPFKRKHRVSALNIVMLQSPCATVLLM